MVRLFLGPDTIAKAIVLSCKRTGDDPIACARGVYGIRGRVVARAALRECFPEANQSGIARGCGYSSPGGNWLNAAMAQTWWRDEWLTEVIETLAGPPEPTVADIPQPVVLAAGLGFNVYRTPSGGRVVDRRSTEAVNLGDPAPGRSALDQGYSPGSGLAHERGSR